MMKNQQEICKKYGSKFYGIKVGIAIDTLGIGLITRSKNY